LPEEVDCGVPHGQQDGVEGQALDPCPALCCEGVVVHAAVKRYALFSQCSTKQHLLAVADYTVESNLIYPFN
jgi:hypothetical protein